MKNKFWHQQIISIHIQHPFTQLSDLPLEYTGISLWSTLGSQISSSTLKKCYFKKKLHKILFISLLKMVIIIIQYFIMTKFTLQLIWTEILFFSQIWTCYGSTRLGYACSFWNCVVVTGNIWKIGLMIL